MEGHHLKPGTGGRVLFRLSGLRKEYPMGELTVHALQAVDLEIYSGEFLVILGPSGSGKSTLLNLIGGMDTPTDGRLLFRQEDLAGYDEPRLTHYRRQYIGFVFQFYNLIPNLTALENVEMATQISIDPADPERMLALVGLSERANHFPAQLSGGEQQRVAIARAVAKQPEVLLCDEPTGALDQQTGKVVLRMLQEVHDRLGTTVVIISHNAAIGGLGDRVVRMRDGRVTEVQVNERPLSAEEISW